MKFISTCSVRGNFNCDFSIDVIKNEPMFFNSSLSFAYANGGDITKTFIEGLPSDWLECNPVLDSRVHMLMKNWYPCILVSQVIIMMMSLARHRQVNQTTIIQNTTLNIFLVLLMVRFVLQDLLMTL